MIRLPSFLPFVVALSVLSACISSPINPRDYDRPIKLACVGDSITAGSGSGPGQNSYPAQLGRMLGTPYSVRNFGVSGATLLKAGDKPYDKQSLYTQALAWKPDVVVIMLGTNDTKPQNWSHKGDFIADYRTLVESFLKLDSKPRVFVVRPCPVTGDNSYGIKESGVIEEIPMIDAVVVAESAGLIDVHAAMAGKVALFPDNVHPSRDGATLLAKTVYKALAGGDYAGPDPTVAPPATRPANP